MLFLLKKIISALLMPLGMFWVTLLLGLALLKRAPRLARGLMVLSLITLFVFSNGFVSYQLAHALEKPYAPLRTVPAPVTTVVVLGGGIRDIPGLPANQQLGGVSMGRLLEGIRCIHLLEAQHQTPQLVLSGGAVFGQRTEAETMASVVKQFGLTSGINITIEKLSRDTADQARLLKKTLGAKPFVLVTSATHMPRSMMLFERLGMHPIAAPADRHSYSTHGPWLLHILPNANNLVMADTAIHEYLGYLWSYIVHY